MKIVSNKNVKSQLEDLFNNHKKKPFPEVVPNEDLADIKGELALYDGHVAGLVSSYLKNAPINSSFVEIDRELEKRIQNFEPKNIQEEKNKADLISYKHKLDELISHLAYLLQLPPHSTRS